MPEPMNRTITPSAQSAPGKRRGRGAMFNLLLLIGIIAAIALFAWAKQQQAPTTLLPAVTPSPQVSVAPVP